MFEDLVARQAGVVSLAQAVASGYSADRVRRRVREGRWRRLRPRVFLVGGHRLTDEARVRAAWLWAGPRAAVTGPAAAFWHGMLPRAPVRVELTVPAAAKPRPPPSVQVHRRDLARPDVTAARGIRVAAPGLAVLQTAIVLPDGSAFLDRALQRHVRFEELYRAYCRAMGRPGSADMARLVVAAAQISAALAAAA